MPKERAKPRISSELILETMAEGVVVLDDQGMICRWNNAMTEMTGFSAAEAIGRHLSWLRFPDCPGSQDISKLLELEHSKSRDAARSACLWGCECQLQGKQGERIPVLINARVIRNQEGRPIGLLNTITDFRAVYELRGEVARLQGLENPPDAFQGLIGKDVRMQEVFRLIELAAASDATVLLLGESGTGKELAAEAVHRLSHRKERPFVKVNCGALSETILESELFGHVKGAFTGAFQDRQGRFEAADTGTLFLDEIGEVSPAVQVKLLRFLQQQEFERVGETRTRKVDVRVIAATNRDLRQAMRHGSFREDLYYRLRVFPIHIPPLRERLDDVPLLVHSFVRRFSQKTGKQISGFDAEAMRALLDYGWPGNVRELENAIEFAFVTCAGGKAGLLDLPQEIRRAEWREGGSAHADPAGETVSAELAESILHDEKRLAAAVSSAGWNKAQVARDLGVARKTVWKWMKRHGLPLQPAADPAQMERDTHT